MIGYLSSRETSAVAKSVLRVAVVSRWPDLGVRRDAAGHMQLQVLPTPAGSVLMLLAIMLDVWRPAPRTFCSGGARLSPLDVQNGRGLASSPRCGEDARCGRLHTWLPDAHVEAATRLSHSPAIRAET